MAQSVIAAQPASQLAQLPPECIVKIFGFLDLKGLGVVALVCRLFEKLQQTELAWCALFPQIESFRRDLSVKARTQLLFKPISLGCQEDGNRCILDAYKKTVTQLDAEESTKSCIRALSHPSVPNGSFIVYDVATTQSLG